MQIKSLDKDSLLFLQIKEWIEDQIITGAFGENSQIPSTTQIVEWYNVNHITVSKGVKMLIDDGVLYKKRGVGMFVREGARNRLVEARQQKFLIQYIEPMLAEAEKLDIDFNALIDIIFSRMDSPF